MVRDLMEQRAIDADGIDGPWSDDVQLKKQSRRRSFRRPGKGGRKDSNVPDAHEGAIRGYSAASKSHPPRVPPFSVAIVSSV